MLPQLNFALVRLMFDKTMVKSRSMCVYIAV